MKRSGFTLIELMVVVAILATIAAVVIGGYDSRNTGSPISVGVHGIAQVRCMDGYKFVVGPDGHMRQVIDDSGKGVKC